MQFKCLCAAPAVILILALLLMGCSGGGGAILPDVAGTDEGITSSFTGQGGEFDLNKGGRTLWGLWLMHLNEDHSAIEVEPLRDASFHLNVTGYLENSSIDCLIIQSVSWTDDDTLMVNIKLKHPPEFGIALTGWDVRGIAILPWEKKFPGTLITNDKSSHPQIYASRRLINADGYTTIWNRWTAEAVEHPQIFGYLRGNWSTNDEYWIEGNLHGYQMFYTDLIRHPFQDQNSANRDYEFDFPPGPLTFAYAVDANWDAPFEKPVDDIWDDFSVESANCPEPYQISVSLANNTLTKVGGSVDVTFDVLDWQDPTNFSHVHVEAPDLFYGTIELFAATGYPDANTARYDVTIPNTKGSAMTAGGGSDLLIVVEDALNSTCNPDLTAYNIFKLPVQDVAGFWRDRNGDGLFINKPLAMVQPSSPTVVLPDIAVVSYPDPDYDFFNGDPELLLFDTNDSRYIVYDRDLDSSFIKSGYPIDTAPPSWLLDPFCMDANNSGWFGVGSTSSVTVSGSYLVKHIINMFTRGGLYGYSWHTGTDFSGYLETIRDVTAGMGNVTGDPVYGLFAFRSGAIPTAAHVLEVGYPYIDPGTSNTFRTAIPMGNAAAVPGEIYYDADLLKCAIDTDPVWNPFQNLHWAFYVVETDLTGFTSEIEGFDINFMNLGTVPFWTLTNADIQTEFPGAWAIDCEVVPALTKHVTLLGDQTAQYNWLCVLMTDGVDYWLAFYDPLNPSPDNPTVDNLDSIYVSNKATTSGGTIIPTAMDVDHQYFEVYVLCRDAADTNYYGTVYEFFY